MWTAWRPRSALIMPGFSTQRERECVCVVVGCKPAARLKNRAVWRAAMAWRAQLASNVFTALGNDVRSLCSPCQFFVRSENQPEETKNNIKITAIRFLDSLIRRQDRG